MNYKLADVVTTVDKLNNNNTFECGTEIDQIGHDRNTPSPALSELSDYYEHADIVHKNDTTTGLVLVPDIQFIGNNNNLSDERAFDWIKQEVIGEGMFGKVIIHNI